MPFEDIIPTMKLIDLHTHLLPNIDDSKLEMNQLEKMLKKYKDANIKAIALTPHLYNPYVHTDLDLLGSRYKIFDEMASDYGIITSLGSEVYVNRQEIIKGIPISLKFQLIEFSTKLPCANLVEKVRALKKTGVEVIIAHVERYPFMSLNSPLFKELKQLGVLFQVNVAGAENGSAIPFLEEEVADIISTDNHGDFTLPERYLKQLINYPYLVERMESLNIFN
jgi:protein-tyrosine phosphatase